MELLRNVNWALLADQAAPLLFFTGVAIALLFVNLMGRDQQFRGLAALVAFIGTVLTMALIVPRWLGGAEPVAIAFWYFDRLSWAAALLLLGTTALAIPLAPAYLRDRKLPQGEYLALLLFATFGMWCMVATHHLFIIFLGLETMSLAAYVMAAFHRTERNSIEAGIKYFVLGAVAAAFLLFGLAFLYGGTGTLDLLRYAALDFSALESSQRIYTLVGVACVLIGFAFKVAAFPFHWWAPDVYKGAPLPVTAFFATGVKAGAFIALWRVAEGVAGFGGAAWDHLFWWAAVLTMTLGNLAALTQEDLKRMLAYSSIAHAGYALMALAIVRISGGVVVSSLLFYLIAYTLMTIGAFAILIALGTKEKEQTMLSHVAGLAGRRPGLAAAFTVFLLSLAGIPPTIGFFGKYYLFQSAMGAGLTGLVVIAVLNSVVSVAYYVRPIVVMYFRPEPTAAEGGSVAAINLTRGVQAVIVVTLLGVLAWGLFPSQLLRLLLQSAG